MEKEDLNLSAEDEVSMISGYRQQDGGDKARGTIKLNGHMDDVNVG